VILMHNLCHTMSMSLTLILTPRPATITLIILIFFYQNVRGLCTKCTKFYDVCAQDYKIISITEMWLRNSFSSHNLFPDTFLVVHAHRDLSESNLSSSGGALVAVHHSVRCKRKYNLELTAQYMCIEIPVPDCFSLLIGKRLM
jgi:hypothetical protein